MKILLSVTYFSPYNSGLTNYVKTLAGELAAYPDYQITVLCMKHEKALPIREITDGYLIIRANPILKLSKGFLSFDWIIQSWREAEKNDLVIINLPQLEAVVNALIAKLMKKRVISIYHAKVELRGGLSNRLIQVLLEMANYIIMALSDKVITYTQDYANNNPELLNWKNKTDWIYPPIKIPGCDKQTEVLIRGKIPAGVTIKVGMAARLAEDKGFEFMINALPKLEDKFGKGKVAVLVAGPTDPVGEIVYKQRILNMLEPVKNKFIFLGEIANEHIGSFYKQIDVLTVPSILESFGIVQVEAMMMGVPVVTSNLPGARVPILKSGMGYLVTAGDATALADGLIKAVKNKNRLSKSAGKAKTEFSITKTVKYFRQLFEK